MEQNGVIRGNPISFNHRDVSEEDFEHYVKDHENRKVKTTSIVITNCKVFEGFVPKMSCYKWEGLNQLSLEHFNLTTSAILILIKIPMQNMGFLNLSNNQLNNYSVDHFSKIPFIKMYRLDLSGNLLTNDSVRFIIKSHFPLLKCLLLGDCKINILGVDSLLLAHGPTMRQDASQQVVGIKNSFPLEKFDSMSKTVTSSTNEVAASKSKLIPKFPNAIKRLK